MNRLASESFLFENMIADTPRLQTVYRSYWQGRHAAAADEQGQAGITRLMHEAGVASTLITDDDRIAQHSLAADFDEQILVPSEPVTEPADDVGETRLARLFAEATGHLERSTTPRLLWIHASAMDSAWDAPLEFRRQFADEEDPRPPDFVEPPNCLLNDNFDPDELLGITHAYAGQVAMLDLVLGAFLDAVDATELGKHALLALTSPRGFPLGEHRRVGRRDEALYGELTGCPLMIRLPDRTGACGRSRALVQPPDLSGTLFEWFDLEHAEASYFSQSLLPVVREQRDGLRQVACATTGEQFALRTLAWFMLRAESNEELFVKPDDRWEVNDVADRRQDVVAEMRIVEENLRRSLTQRDAQPLEPLGDILLTGPE